MEDTLYMSVFIYIYIYIMWLFLVSRLKVLLQQYLNTLSQGVTPTAFLLLGSHLLETKFFFLSFSSAIFYFKNFLFFWQRRFTVNEILFAHTDCRIFHWRLGENQADACTLRNHFVFCRLSMSLSCIIAHGIHWVRARKSSACRMIMGDFTDRIYIYCKWVYFTL